MIAPSTLKRAPWLRRWGWLAAAAAAYGILACVIVAVRAESSSDFRDYWETARHFRQTGEITDQLGVHNYLPFFTVLMVPWSLLPLRIAIVIFTLVSLGLFTLAVVMAETLLCDGLPRRPRPALLAALGLMLAYVYSCTVLGAVGLLVTFLIVATWFLFERGREWPAGVALGLATLIKLLPGLLIIFFLLQRRWRVAAGAAGVVLLFGLGLPLLSLGPRQACHEHEAFYRRAVEQHSAWATVAGERPHKIHYRNSALPAVLRRLLTHTNSTPDDRGTQLFVNFANLPSTAVFAGYVALLAAILGASVFAARRSRPDAHDPRTLRVPFGIWCCAMLLASPLLWIHYLPMAYWPVALLTDGLERTRRAEHRLDRPTLLILALWLGGVFLLAWPAARAAGAQLAALLALWLLLTSHALRRLR